MAESVRFENLLRNIRKTHSTSEATQIQGLLEDAFITCMPNAPEDLAYDIFYYFSPPDQLERDQLLDTVSEKLKQVIYLFEMDLARIEVSLEIEDWDFIKETVSSFALELPQDLLVYIMTEIVRRGIFDEHSI